MVVTLWGSTAEGPGRELEEQAGSAPVVAISSCRVSSYNGVSGEAQCLHLRVWCGCGCVNDSGIFSQTALAREGKQQCHAVHLQCFTAVFACRCTLSNPCAVAAAARLQ